MALLRAHSRLNLTLEKLSQCSSLARSCYGASAAMIAHVATYPNDTIRRRMQARGGNLGRGETRGPPAVRERAIPSSLPPSSSF
eukprot:711510-Pleurochrysis_carterae.AAC.1